MSKMVPFESAFSFQVSAFSCRIQNMKVSLDELNDFAKHVVADLPNTPGSHAHVIGLSGNLGAGKTTFTQLVAKELGVDSTVHSPTYTLLQSYPIDNGPFKKLIHIDAYRLTPNEKDTIGWREYVADPTNFILVEWPENLPGWTRSEFPMIKFSVVDEETREVAHHYAP